MVGDHDATTPSRDSRFDIAGVAQPFGSTTSSLGREFAQFIKVCASDDREESKELREWLSQSLRILESLPTSRVLRAEFLRAQGEFLRISADPAAAVVYFQLAQQQFATLDDDLQVASLDRSLAMAFLELGEQALTVHHLQRAASIYAEAESNEALAFVSLQLASIEHENRHFNEALAAASIARRTARKIKNSEYLHVVDQLIVVIRRDASAAGSKL